MSIKRTIILASAVVALPISILLIGNAIERRKRNSKPTPELMRQPKSTSGFGSNSSIITSIHDHQQKENSQSLLPTPSQGSDTVTETNANNSTNIGSKNIPDNYLTASVLTSQQIVSSGTAGSDIIVSNQPTKEDGRSFSEQSKEKRESLRELIVAAVKKARDSEKEKGLRTKEQTIAESITTDSKAIHSLSEDLHAQVNIFDKTLSAIRKENYDKQVKLLDSYKELLMKQLKVIHARGRIARKLKPGA
jgi:hypothetical protein